MKIHSAYILAGGQSKRFGSDKALAEIRGSSLLQHAIDTLSPSHNEIYLSTDRPDRYPTYDLQYVTDERSHLGPMNGILTSLKHSRDRNNNPALITIWPCDMWQLTPQHHQHLVEIAKHASDKKAFIYQDEFPQVTYGLYHTDLIPELQCSLDAENYSMTRFIRNHKSICEFASLPPELPVPISINTPADLNRIISEN